MTIFFSIQSVLNSWTRGPNPRALIRLTVLPRGTYMRRLKTLRVHRPRRQLWKVYDFLFHTRMSCKEISPSSNLFRRNEAMHLSNNANQRKLFNHWLQVNKQSPSQLICRWGPSFIVFYHAEFIISISFQV